MKGRLDAVSQQLVNARLMLAKAALRDVSWLNWVQRTMMPKQPSRVPFHNSVEVAIRGYHAAAGGRQKPILTRVTRSKLPYNEDGFPRGYYASIIFYGSGFTFAHRRRGHQGPPPGNRDYIWHLPNIYFGTYLEVASSADEPEAPLSWRDYEFAVRNPEGQTSDWIPFSFAFDDDTLMQLINDFARQGRELFTSGNPADAAEPLRKAWIFSDRLLCVDHEQTLRLKRETVQAREHATLAKLRFRPGDMVSVSAGPHAGRSGIVEKLLLNHYHAYLIKPTDGEPFQAADEQVQRAAVAMHAEPRQ